MAIKKSAQKPRSPTTVKVFGAFLSELRADSLMDSAVADRLEAALSLGQTINADNLQDALFPKKGAEDE